MRSTRTDKSPARYRPLRIAGIGAAVAIVAVSSVTACSSSKSKSAGSPTSGGSSSISIGAVGGLAITQALPVAVAQNKGYFTKNGLKVSIVSMSTPSIACQAVQSGSVQMAQCAAGSYVPVNLHGGDLVQFETYFTTISPYYFMVPKNVTSWSQLSGKSFGISGAADIPAWMLSTMAAKNGLAPGSYKTAVVGSSGARLAALTSGAVSGTLLAPPDNLKAEAAGFHQLDESIKYFPPNTFSQADFIANGSWLKKNPVATTAWLKSIADANAWITDAQNKTDVLQFLTTQYNLKTPAAAAALYAAYVGGNVISHSLCNSVVGMQQTGKALVALGTITQSEYQDFENKIPTYATNTYVEKALGQKCTSTSS